MEGSGKVPPKVDSQPPVETARTDLGDTIQEPVTGPDGRAISPRDPRTLVAGASALVGPDESARPRAVAKKMTPQELKKVTDRLEESSERIKSFMTAHHLKRGNFKLKCDRDSGFDQKSIEMMVVMEQLKGLIEEHTQLLNKCFGVVGGAPGLQRLEHAARHIAKHGPRTPEQRAFAEEMAQLPNAEGLRKQYWTERGYIQLYAAFCLDRYNAAHKVIRLLEGIQTSDAFVDRIEEFIPQTLEFMRVLEEVIRCQIGLENHHDLDGSVENLKKAGTTVALLASLAGPTYVQRDKKEEIRKLLQVEAGCFAHWLEVCCLSEDDKGVSGYEFNSLICSAVLLDEPVLALRFLQRFAANVKSEEFPARDSFRLCMGLLFSLTWLYDREEPLREHRARVEAASNIVNEFAALVNHIDQNQLVSAEDRASLLVLFNQVRGHCQEVIDNLIAQERAITETGDALMKEEDEVKEKIQNKLVRRERRRREREKARLEALEQQQTQNQDKTQEPDETAVDATGSDDEVLHPAFKKAMGAFTDGEPDGVIKEAFEEVLNDKDASKFDHAQAHYGYADMLAVRLKKPLDRVYAMIDGVYEYQRVLKSGQLPSSSSEFQFNDALSLFNEETKELNMKALRMSQVVKKALDAFYLLDEAQEEFLDQLVELHDQMEAMVVKARKVSQCCQDMPEIYKLRGSVIKSHKLEASKKGAKRRQALAERIQLLERTGKQLEVSINYLEASLDRARVDVALEDYGKTAPVLGREPDAGPLRSARRNSPKSRSPSPKSKPISDVSVQLERAHVRTLMEALPVELRNELGKMASLPELASELSWSSARSFRDFHPLSGVEPHPLSELAAGLMVPLIVKSEDQRWLVQPGVSPVDADHIAIPKQARKLNFEFTTKEKRSPVRAVSAGTVELKVTETKELPSSEDVIAGATVVSASPLDQPVSTSAQAFQLPLRMLMPHDVQEALKESMKEVLEAENSRLSKPEENGPVLTWKLIDKGLVVAAVEEKQPEEPVEAVKEEKWQVAGTRKKKKKSKVNTKSGTTRETVNSSEAGKASKPKVEVTVTTEQLQIRLRDYLNTIRQTGRLPSGEPVPVQFDLSGVVARIHNGTFMSDPKIMSDDFSLLAEVLNVPIYLSPAPTEVQCYKPGFVKPSEVDTKVKKSMPYLTLEYCGYGGQGRWFASVTHAFHYGDEQQERAWMKKREARSWADL